ncbi:NAD-dependent epimerase/dehydratase family protein [Azospirillum doebereinerae]|uniref:NAD(P)-dependent oxidoreductase n=1 Tax=Azospirillum doebereinerae TaxID=92933 RepID=A0A433J6L4_9PROT|nr:NAD(P)-dependent oxidoreductase [Azospirillum doebereinerae]MCG5238955.1 NAD(P)-dependent oxidoreductase [Azospirillum doebereinerae]RUQ68822.1 NAD(P)-dependent oxidoreductase [Azospirillum doebereinerae]
MGNTEPLSFASPGQAPRCLVTGATGYVGRRLVARLLARGAVVDAFVRPGSKTDVLPAGDGRLHIHCVADDTMDVIRHCKAIRPDIVFHLASKFIAQHAVEDVRPLIDSNLLFGTRLLEGMAAAGTRFLVNVGTYWQHFEDRDYEPANLYAATKQAFEAIALYHVRAHGLGMVNLHLFDTYGPGDPRPKLLQLLKRIARSGERLAMSPGEQKLDLVHIDDVLDAFETAGDRLLASRIEDPRTFAIRSGRSISVRELVALFERCTGTTLDIGWGERPYRAREVMLPWSQGLALPGWQARIPLDTGIRQVWNDV